MPRCRRSNRSARAGSPRCYEQAEGSPPQTEAAASPGTRPSGASRGYRARASLAAGAATGTKCSRSGTEAAYAPRVAGSTGPRRAARRATDAIPLPISKRRLRMSSCGDRSPARCKTGPSKSAREREPANLQSNLCGRQAESVHPRSPGHPGKVRYAAACRVSDSICDR